MKIRSITCFVNPGWPVAASALEQADRFAASARQAYTDAGYEVQTIRLATPSFAEFAPELAGPQLVEMAQRLEAQAGEHGFEYLALGPAQPDQPEGYLAIPNILSETRNVFVSAHMTTPDGGVSLPAVKRCAGIIERAAQITPDGFTNLRFCALANVPPGAPFFPAAYHAIGRGPAFALATEAADLAVEAFSGADSVAEACNRLRQSVEAHARRLAQVAQELRQRFEIDFGGLDFSPAPFPEEQLSLGTAIERLGAPAMGLHGSLAAAALLAHTIDQAEFPHAGFSGLLLSVLEDYTLALRAGEGVLSVKDLLMYSAVCGTGLDTIPLPGDTTQDQLFPVLLDLAVLSQRLNKPLTARLMPIPGKVAGDPTGFDFTYFVNSRVMSLEAQPMRLALSEDEVIYLGPRPPRP